MLTNFRSSQVIQVIETVTCEGHGVAGDPIREVTTYTDLAGNVLARRDEFAPPPPTTPEDHSRPYTLTLDDYEVANLRAAIEAAGFWGYRLSGKEPVRRNPLFALNTGDWIGQIYNRLPTTTHRPNKTPEELAACALESHWSE